jgi:hypothetical protein
VILENANTCNEPLVVVQQGYHSSQLHYIESNAMQALSSECLLYVTREANRILNLQHKNCRHVLIYLSLVKNKRTINKV